VYLVAYADVGAAAALGSGLVSSAAYAAFAAVAGFQLVPGYLTGSARVAVAAELVPVCLVSSAVVAACPVDLALCAEPTLTLAESELAARFAFDTCLEHRSSAISQCCFHA
jgi:hypothetical protein